MIGTDEENQITTHCTHNDLALKFDEKEDDSTKTIVTYMIFSKFKYDDYSLCVPYVYKSSFK